MQVELTALSVKKLANAALNSLGDIAGPGSTAQRITVRKILNLANHMSPHDLMTVTADDFQWLTEGVIKETSDDKPQVRRNKQIKSK